MSFDPNVALQDAFWLRAEELLFHHTNPWELDEALCDRGYAMGPCEAMDLVGLDTVLERAPNRLTPVLKRMVAEGRMGKKGGVGFYRYPGGGGAVIDPLIEDLIREEAWFAGVERIEVSPEMLVDAMNETLFESCEKSGLDQAERTALLHGAVHYPKQLPTLKRR